MGAACCGRAANLADAELAEDFSYAGLTVPARVLSVYDGDTVRVAFLYRGELQQHRVRLLGYDSPEMRQPRDAPDRGEQKAAAVAARDALARHTGLGQGPGRVSLTCGPFDKYGRILGRVYTPAGQCINNLMLLEGHGSPYNP